MTRFTAKVTHLVTVAGNPKIEEAAKKGVHVVSEEWLHESVAKKAKQDEKKFELTAAAAAPAAGAKRGGDDDNSDAGKAKGRGKRAKKADDDTAAAATTAAPAAPAAAPAAAPSSPAPEEKKVKVIKKGRAPVDPTSGLVNTHHVYSDNDGTVWDCMLNQVRIAFP